MVSNCVDQLPLGGWLTLFTLAACTLIFALKEFLWFKRSAAKDEELRSERRRCAHLDQENRALEEALNEAIKREKLAAERLLSESEAQWRKLVESAALLLFTANANGHVDYVSQGFQDYTGIAEADLLSRETHVRYLHPEDRGRVLEILAASYQTGIPYEFEYRLRGKEGNYRWFKVIGKPILNLSGQVMKWISASLDIDNQKRSEEALEEAVARRTAELSEALAQAEAATRAKSEFLAAMSHEIRTPMNGVIGMAHLMLDTEMTSQQRSYMDTIRSSGDALLTVINDILDLSKIEAGKLRLERTDFDFSTLLEETIDVVAVQAAAKGLELNYELDKSIPLDLVGDPARLRQIVLNLLSNAVKFTAQGSVTLSVSREASQQQTTVLRVAVRDTGIGLTEKQQQKLFQAFQQAELSTSRLFGGTGLGLVISKKLVEMMGGVIGVHSQLGEGSTFWFNVCLETAAVFAHPESFIDKRVGLICRDARVIDLATLHLESAGLRVSTHPRLPKRDAVEFDVLVVDSAALAQASDALDLLAQRNARVVLLGTKADLKNVPLDQAQEWIFVPKPARRLPLLRGVESSLAGHSGQAHEEEISRRANFNAQVLLAEDNKVNQMVARLLLEKLGCTVDIVEDGVAACAAVQRKAYDVVLMDCQMPVMSGFEATRRIRGLETGNRRTPIIALTAGVLPDERERCYSSGMDDFLSKPIAPKDLENALERWISVMQGSLS